MVTLLLFVFISCGGSSSESSPSSSSSGTADSTLPTSVTIGEGSTMWNCC